MNKEDEAAERRRRRYGSIVETIDVDLRRMLIKDYAIPAKIPDDGYLSVFLDEMLPHYDFHQAVDDLLYGVGSLGRDDFVQSASKFPVRTAVKIAETDVYKKFSSEGGPAPGTLLPHMPPKNLFVPENAGSDFIGIDIIKANFSVVAHYAPEVVGGHLEYEDFARDYTDLDYVVNCKRMRQVLFGNLNPKRIRSLVKGAMIRAATHLQDTGLPWNRWATCSDDEMVVKGGISSHDIFMCLEEFSAREMPAIRFRVEPFWLFRLPDSTCYYKQYSDGRIKLKNTPAHLFMQAYKKIVGLPLYERDLSFIFEDEIAVLKHPKWSASG